MVTLRHQKSLTEMIAPYPGKWVVMNLEETEVLGVAKSLKVAMKQAKKNGVKIPSVIKSPEHDLNGFTYGAIKTTLRH